MSRKDKPMKTKMFAMMLVAGFLVIAAEAINTAHAKEVCLGSP
jgi:hypothetical protein